MCLRLKKCIYQNLFMINKVKREQKMQLILLKLAAFAT